MLTETSTPPVDLTTFERLLQQRLQAKLTDIAPLQVNCFIKRETLLMVVQHPAPILAHPNRAFRVLEEAFQEEGLQDHFRGLMYLEVEGRNQPYAFHTFTEELPKEDVAEQVKATTPEGLKAAAEQQKKRRPLPPPPPPRRREIEEIPPPQFIDPDTISLSSNGGGTSEVEFDIDSLNLAPELPAFPEEDFAESHEPDKMWVGVIIAGAVVSAVVFFGSLYLLSRPCVLRSCETLDVAQELADRAFKTLEAPPSGQAILEAQVQLTQAMGLLESIPPWSGKHQQAQAFLSDYGTSAQRLEELVGALRIATQGANLSQNPPHSVEQWTEAQKAWQEAIAKLNRLPVTSPFYEFAQGKVQEYRKNLVVINRRLQAERDAVESFAAAQEATKIAEARQGIAQSLNDLQLASATWETAVDRLRGIPQGTTPYEEAQQLLAANLPKLSAARDREKQEQFASDAYNQAVRLAQLAKMSETRNQWSEAVAQWRNALNYLEQISSTSFDYAKAQPLVKSYQDSLSEAESRLKESLQVRQARTDLDRICKGKDLVCVYTVTDRSIRVRLTPTYIERVQQTARQAQQSNNFSAQVNILDHIFAVEQALEEVSDNAGIPLEIYTSENVLVKRYNPQ